jgi:hypothetical protein
MLTIDSAFSIDTPPICTSCFAQMLSGVFCAGTRTVSTKSVVVGGGFLMIICLL